MVRQMSLYGSHGDIKFDTVGSSPVLKEMATLTAPPGWPNLMLRKGTLQSISILQNPAPTTMFLALKEDKSFHLPV